MLSFTQINLHKAAQATTLVGRDLEGGNSKIILLTEPYTVRNNIVSMPRGTKTIYARQKEQEPCPRAGIVASLDVRITAMDSWCNRDCAVALAKLGGKQTIVASIYLDITSEVQPRWLTVLCKWYRPRAFR